MMLHLVWVAMTVLRVAGVVLLMVGVGWFGVYFIAGNGRSSDGTVPRSSWLGPGPRQGMKIAVLGIGTLFVAFILSLILPDGT
jgi:hypothetical protein